MTPPADVGRGEPSSPAPPRTRGHETSPRLSEDGERQFEAVRRALVARRRELGLSMSSLARQVGVSPSLISQIERGQTLPSVATLFALAAALGATVDAFFDESAADAPSPAGSARSGASAHGRSPSADRYVVRRSDRATIAIRGGVSWERLTQAALEDLEFLELVYEPYAESDPELYRHPGVEMLLVLEGRFDIYVGFERYSLGVGDSMSFPSSLPHRYVNPTGEVARAVTVIVRDAVAPQAPPSRRDAHADGGNSP